MEQIQFHIETNPSLHWNKYNSTLELIFILCLNQNFGFRNTNSGLQKYKLKRKGQTNTQTHRHTHQYHDSAWPMGWAE